MPNFCREFLSTLSCHKNINSVEQEEEGEREKVIDQLECSTSVVIYSDLFKYFVINSFPWLLQSIYLSVWEAEVSDNVALIIREQLTYQEPKV